MVKSLPVMRETQVRSLGQEDPFEKEQATHFSILAWEIPWTEEPGRLQAMGHKESDTTEWLHFHFHMYVESKLSKFIKQRVEWCCQDLGMGGWSDVDLRVQNFSYARQVSSRDLMCNTVMTAVLYYILEIHKEDRSD